MGVTIERRPVIADLEFPDQLHPLLKRIYRQRQLGSPEELDLGFSKLLPPDKLKGMTAATGLLEQALREDWRILIVADFDADGATSCAVVMQALRQMGATHVDYIVPNRFDYGYGLTPEIVALAIQRDPHLIITVDNGISSIDGVEAALAAGVRVLVTDHHLAPEQLPRADAIVNPNQPGCDFPSKSIAGVGVIFYVMLALRARLREQGWFAEKAIAEPQLAELLDLVALGTVADVVALDHNNRILVDAGLRRIRAGRSRPGIMALLQVSNRQAQNLSASDLGFSLGPRLNAAGRLDDMSTGIECLMATDALGAERLARQLDGMNQDRKQIESEMKEQAFAILDQLDLADQQLPAALSLFDPRWHQGVVGILASRVKDRVHRPVIAFAEVDESGSGELKGSARSIKGFHIRDALDAVATRHPGLVNKFGGHAMAAGLSLPRDRFEEFSQAFADQAQRMLSEELLSARVYSDGEIAAEDLQLQTAEMLRQAGPWGQEFPEPQFDGRFKILQQREVGKGHLKLLLCPPDNPQHCLDAIAFNVAAEDWPAADASEIDLVYRLERNEFRGQCSLQLMVEHIIASR
jgi:single-stranded-DNA-specific exonuclease